MRLRALIIFTAFCIPPEREPDCDEAQAIRRDEEQRMIISQIDRNKKGDIGLISPAYRQES